MEKAFIIGAVRTATGKDHGRLSKCHPTDLCAAVIDELMERTGMDRDDKVDDVIVGCVNKIGAQSANIGRSVEMASTKVNVSVPGTTVDRQGGSSLQAIHFAAQAIMSGTQNVVIGAGVELMSLIPMGAANRDAFEKGRGEPIGLLIGDRYKGARFDRLMGAEMIARKHGLTREELDQFALSSHSKAAAATKEGRFKKEIMPVEVELAGGSKEIHEVDECIRLNADINELRALKPLMEGGVITAASSGQIGDGAAAVLLASACAVKKYNLKPRAAIHTMTVVGSDPILMLEGPIPATQKILKKANLSIGDIDLYEINETFGSVPLAWAKAVGADMNKLNVNGGAQALGHPLGGTGAKLVATLLHELERTGGRFGLVVIGEDRGTANAMIIERI